MYTVSANTLEASVGVIYTGNMWQQEPSKVVPYDDMVVTVLVVVVLRVGECSCPTACTIVRGSVGTLRMDAKR